MTRYFTKIAPRWKKWAPPSDRLSMQITGTRNLGNMGNGILADNSGTNTIGGTISGAGNLISGNLNGVVISGSSAVGNAIQGNLIGTQRDGVSPLGNRSHGIVISNSANLNMIGGAGATVCNVIALNAGCGVTVAQGVRNTIRGNSIFQNGVLGIDLGMDGVTPNDPCDADAGPNNLVNYPVLTSATNCGSLTIVTRTLNSVPNPTFTLEFFSDHTTDPTTYGQGRIFLGSTNVTTDAGCNANFTAILSPPVPAGDLICATGTEPGGSTSEFSQSIIVVQPRLAFSSSAGKYQISWPSLVAGFHLECANNLAPPTYWTTVTNAVVLTNGCYGATVSAVPGNHFYRLAKPSGALFLPTR